MRRNIFHLALVGLVAGAVLASVSAWVFFKPIRVVAPELNGVLCTVAICVEDSGSWPIASDLYRQAVANVATKLRPLTSRARVIFCSTQRCYRSFGGQGRGITVFDLGVVIAPESWQVYIVEHELIHMLQAQELGLLGRERSPLWFKEGMAFSISEPPDCDLPQYARPWVAEYRNWEERVGRENVWTEINRK